MQPGIPWQGSQGVPQGVIGLQTAIGQFPIAQHVTGPARHWPLASHRKSLLFATVPQEGSFGSHGEHGSPHFIPPHGW